MNPYLSTLEPIWNDPKHVFIEEVKLKELATSLSGEEIPVPSWREPIFPEEEPAVLISFLGVGNAINFAFKNFESKQSFSVEWRGKEWWGAFGMWACLSRALEEDKHILAAEYLANVTTTELETIFRGKSNLSMIPERCEILNEVGKVLGDKYGGQFSNLFEKANYTAFGNRGIVSRLVSEFPSFCDQSVHSRTRKILQFHKRAQLFAMMYQGRALSSNKLESLSDYGDLGPIADYAVPKALRVAGILRYSKELESKIRAQELIEKDSEQEQEIRAQTSQAQFKLLKYINECRVAPITMLSVDYKVWSLGRGGTEPHHLTITTNY